MMKNILLLISFFLVAVAAQAQLPMIDTLYVIPSPAAENDSVKLIYSATFSSGGCDMFSNSLQNTNDTLTVIVEHCEGMLDYICTSTDTLNLGELNAGNYHLKFRLLLGSGDFGPCNNFYLADTNDIDFEVSPMTTAGKIADVFNFKIDNQKIFINTNKLIEDFYITDLSGRNIYALNEKFTGIKIIYLPNNITNGIYFMSYNSATEFVSSKILITGK